LRLTSLALATLVAQQSAASPNVLLVIADDMGVDVSPCYSEKTLARMPNLEALCGNGVVFENAYSAPLCSPTRATIMKGNYGFRTGVGSVPSREGGGGLSKHEESLFDRLNDANYSSALIGKWHLSANALALDHPQDLGVDYFFGPLGGGLKDYEKWTAVENGRRVSVSNYATSELSDRAIDWIADQQSPWFLWLAYNAPHTPFHLPPDDLHSFDGLSGTERDRKRNSDSYYFAALEALDTEFGRVLDSLSEQELKNTVVIFLGDNGTPTQVLGRDSRGRGKGSLYEGGVHVPLVVSGKGVDEDRSDALVNTTDMFATILTLAGTNSDAIDSVSFMPALSGLRGDRDYAYVEHFSQTERRGGAELGWAIRDSRYKLLSLDDQDPALFDLMRDPDERNNLLGDGVDKYSAKADQLLAARDEIVN